MTFRRLAGIAGIAFVIAVVINIILSGSVPTIDDTTQKVADYYQDESDSLQVAAIFSQVAGVFIAIFAAGVIVALRAAERGTGRAWSIVALIGIITTFAAFDTNSAAQHALLLNADALGDDGLTRAFFDSNSASFASASFNVGIFLLGIGAGVVTTRMLPVWLGWLALLGTGLGFVSAFGFGDRDGLSGIGMAGFGAQVGLLLFALIAGILMATREAEPVGTEAAAA